MLNTRDTVCLKPALLAAAILCACGAAKPVRAQYQKRETWVETMEATRAELQRTHPSVPGFEEYESEILRGGMDPDTISMNIKGVGQLWLVVDTAGDGNGADQAVWGEPVVVAADGTRTPLTSLGLLWFRVGYGNRPKINHNHRREPLRFGDRQLSQGIWAHGPSALCYNLGGRFERFEAMVGLDAASGERGSVVFSVNSRSPDLVWPAWGQIEHDFPKECDWFLHDIGDSLTDWFWQDGEYAEAGVWTEQDRQKYEYYVEKRRRSVEEEHRGIADMLGLTDVPVPLSALLAAAVQ